jgi:hypothetical protein
MEPKIIERSQINEDLEYVALDDGSIEIRNQEESFILDQEGAYRLFLCLERRFPNLPIVEHLNVA